MNQLDNKKENQTQNKPENHIDNLDEKKLLAMLVNNTMAIGAAINESNKLLHAILIQPAKSNDNKINIVDWQSLKTKS